MKKNTLNPLLRAWAARHAPDAAQLKALAARTVEALERQPLAKLADGAMERPAPAWQRYLLAAAAGAAVACLAMALHHGRPRPVGPAAGLAADTPAWPDLTARGPLEPSRLYRPIDELFSGNLMWLVETDTDIRLGLPDNGAPEVRPGALVIVRTVVLTRARTETVWRRLWEVTAATRPEQSIETPLDAHADARLALWVYPLADGAVAVDAALELRQPVVLSINASNVFMPDQPIRILSMQTETADYQVLQMVRQVPAEPGGA